MPFFGVPIRNGLPIGLGSVAGFGVQQFDPSQLFAGGTVAGAWYDPSDLSTMFTTDAGTTPVAMPGQGAGVAVGLILDKSGNGNHARSFGAGASTTRPELRARVNLLTYSEQFDNGAWTKQDSTVANTTATTDPLGGNTADILTDNAVNAEHRVFQTPTNTAGTYVWSFWAKANTLSWLHLGIPNAVGSRQDIYFDVGSGALGTVPAGYTATITSAGNGWWRCAVTGNTQANAYFVLSPSTANNVQSYAGTGQSLYIWGADLRPANIGANVPAYQRIADANTYDTSGFPLYLRFDGVDDSMYTPANLNLSGTDKVAVFAGVRRNATVTQFPVEFSSSDSNNGAFGVGADSGGAEYFFNSRGTTLRQIVVDNAAYNAPVSNVVTLSADIAAPSMIARLNGTQVGSNTSSQGTGNYGTYPLYIGSRNNSTYWLNGHLHSLIIAGSAVSAGNISATEQWVAGKTGLALP